MRVCGASRNPCENEIAGMSSSCPQAVHSTPDVIAGAEVLDAGVVKPFILLSFA
jgi:hypothetical protein